MIYAISLFSFLQNATSETATYLLRVLEIHYAEHYIILLTTKNVMTLWHIGFIIVQSVRWNSDLVNDKLYELSFSVNEIIRISM